MGRLTLTEEQKKIADRVRSGAQTSSTQTATTQTQSGYRGGRLRLTQKQVQIATKYGLPNEDYQTAEQQEQQTQQANSPLHQQYAAFMAYQNALREQSMAQKYVQQAQSGQKKQKNPAKTAKVNIVTGEKLDTDPTTTQNDVQGETISEQEFGRSTAMQKQYGSYDNYLRGITAQEQGKQRLQQQSAALASLLPGTAQKFTQDMQTLNERVKAEDAVQQAQEHGMRRTSQELEKQIKQLEAQKYESHFAEYQYDENGTAYTVDENGNRVEAQGLDEQQARIDELKQRKTQIDSQWALLRAQRVVGELDEETQKLLAQYNRGAQTANRDVLGGMTERWTSGQTGNNTERQYGQDTTGTGRETAYLALTQKGYTPEQIGKLAEYEQYVQDYQDAQTRIQNAQQFGSEHKIAASGLSVVMAPFKALGNIESVRGVLPSWAGGYKNEDMPTNIYSGLYGASQASGAIRQGVMQDWSAGWQFLYQAGMSALDSAMNMAVSTGLVGTVGGVSGAAAQEAVASTMNWVMGSQVAADSVYEGIQSGKSNVDALIDGIVEGAIEGITEKYSVGDIIENMLSGKAVWKKLLRSFASEGAEEIASNWLNRVYDVVAKHNRSEVLAAYAKYIAEGKTQVQALAALAADFAKEDGLSFLAGGISGLGMSGAYAGANRVILEANVAQTARAVVEAGQVQDVVDYGLAQKEDTRAHKLAEAMQKTIDAGEEVTVKDAENVLREVAKEQQAAVDEGEEPRAPETLTRLEQLQQQEVEAQNAEQDAANAEQDAANAEQSAPKDSFEIYRDNVQDIEDRARQMDATGKTDAAEEAEMAEQAASAASARSRVRAEADLAESELDRATFQRERKTLTRAAAEYGLPETIIQATSQSYTEYRRSGGTIQAAEYAEAVNLAFQYGESGMSLAAAMEASEGLPQELTEQAWSAGKGADNETAGQTSYDAGGKRDAGVDTGGPRGTVAEGTGRTVQKQAGGQAAAQRTGLADRVRDAGQPLRSGKEIGLKKGSADKTLREVPKKLWTQDIERAEQTLEKAGFTDIHFFTGKIGIVNQKAKVTRAANGAATGESVWVCADDKAWSAEQIAKHESFHRMADSAPQIVEAVRAEIEKKLGAEGVRELAQKYAEAYEGCYDAEELEHIIEEICADAYAGINRFDALSQSAQEAVWQTEKTQNKEKTGSARAPPVTKMSVSQSENDNRAETQAEITKQYQQSVHDILNGTGNSNEALLVGYTPQVFRKMGMPDLPFVVGSGHVYTMAKTAAEAVADGKWNKIANYHGLGESVVADIMEFVQNPVMVIAAKDVDRKTTPLRSKHSVVALIDVGVGKASMVIPVAITAERTVNGVRMDVNAISSAYEKNTTELVDEAIAQFNTGENSIFYVKEEAANLLGAGVQFPERLKVAASSDGIVHKLDTKINMSVKNVTESQQFKRWFGDWQNHPEKASKVVNADGTPKVMYHGTNAEFTVFDRSQGKKKIHLNVLGEGNYFTERKTGAERYGDRVVEAYLDIRKPYVFDGRSYNTTADQIAEDFGIDRATFTSRDVTKMLKERGYDGVVLYDSDGNVVIANAFTSNQIKSATDNVGTFDKNNPDIRFSVSSESGQEQQAETEQQTAQEKTSPGKYTMDTIPKKAQSYLRGAQKHLTYEIRKALQMPFAQNNASIREQIDALTNEYLQTGVVFQKQIDKAFDAVWEAGETATKDFAERTQDALQQLRQTKVTPTQEELKGVEDPERFKQRARGKFIFAQTGGKSINEVYRELSGMLPELFPRNITDPARQEMALLMGINRMQSAQETQKSLQGKNAELWKTRAKNDFTVAVRDMMGDFRIARRYAEAAARTKETMQAPKTLEEVTELYNKQQEQRQEYEKIARNFLLTAEDNRVVNQLLRGDLAPEQVRGRENADSILAIYAAKADYDLTTLKIQQWKDQARKQRRQAAREALGDVTKYKDKWLGLSYKRETQERNIRDIAPEENAEKIIEKYFQPVRHAAAEETRFINRMNERVKALGLKEKAHRGDKVSESAAVQILGERQDDIRIMKNSQGRIKERDGRTIEDCEAVIQELWETSPGLDRSKIERGVAEFREIYKEALDLMNAARVRNGYAPITERSGYFPHFQLGTSDGILNLMGKAVGVDAGVSVLPNDVVGILRWMIEQKKVEHGSDALPTTINGRTAAFKPGITWFGHALERTGFQTGYGAVEGYAKYIKGAADVIFFTDSIQNLRALTQEIRYLAGDEGMREQIDTVRANESLSEEQKESLVKGIKADGKFTLSKWVNNLEEYTNLLANKKSEKDRSTESDLNREVYRFLGKWQSRVAANMVALNPGSWLTNFGVIAQAAAVMKTTTQVKAMAQAARAVFIADEISERSDFLTSRKGSGRLDNNWIDNASETLSKPMEVIDMFAANFAVRGRYMENLERGMSQELALQEADQFAAGVMGERSKGAMPTIFEAKNPITKMFTQFQLEVNNTFSYFLKDLPRLTRKKGVAALALAMFKGLIGDWLFNEFIEKLYGRRPMQDPINLITEAVGDFTGYEVENFFDALDPKMDVGFVTKREKTNPWVAVKNLAIDVGQEAPFIGNLLGGGRLPYTSTFPDLDTIFSALSSEDMADDVRAQKILSELGNTALYWFLPFGGGQIKKTVLGAKALSQGGSYKTDNDGNDILQYPVYSDRTGDRAVNLAQSLLFGKTATEAAREWVEGGFKSLSAKETAAYQTITEAGEDQRDTYAFILSAKKLDKDYDKKMLLKASALSDEAKAEYYYHCIAGETQQAEMDELSGQERIAYMNDAIARAESDHNRAELKEQVSAGTVTQEKAIQKLVANDWAKDENAAYWTWREWTGGEGYHMYDTFTNTIRDGGDVAQAAQEYLEHGKEAGDLSREITKAFKAEYVAATKEQRQKMKQMLLDAYAAIGYNRKEKSKDIDEWLEEE